MAWKGSGDVTEFRVYGIFEIAPEGETDIPREGDEGTVLIIDMQEDCTTGTNQIFNVLLPDGTETTWSCTINGDNLEYTMPALIKGNYKIVPYIEFP